MAQAFALNPADAQKQADGQRVLDLMRHYALSNDDNYENQGSKTLQFCQAIDGSTTNTAAITNIGATAFYQGLKEANEQCRALIDQRNLERSEAPQQTMVDLRAKTEAEYRDLIFITNAYAIFMPGTPCSTCSTRTSTTTKRRYLPATAVAAATMEAIAEKAVTTAAAVTTVATPLTPRIPPITRALRIIRKLRKLRRLLTPPTTREAATIRR